MLARCHKKPSESVNQRGAPQLSLCKSCFKTGSWRIQRPLYWPSFPILNSFHGGASELAQYTKDVKKCKLGKATFPQKSKNGAQMNCAGADNRTGKKTVVVRTAQPH